MFASIRNDSIIGLKCHWNRCVIEKNKIVVCFAWFTTINSYLNKNIDDCDECDD